MRNAEGLLRALWPVQWSDWLMEKKKQGARKSTSGRGSRRTVTKDPVHSLYLMWLRESLADPRNLLELHNEAREGSGRPRKDLEALKRAAVILAVTSWETFIEDTLRLTFEERLRSASSPRALGNTFTVVAREWMKREKLADNPESLAEFSGDGWRQVVLGIFKEDLDRLHSPDSKKVRRMYQRYLDVDVTAQWKWRGTTSPSALSTFK